MSFYNWIQLVTICLMGAMSPGPSLALIINNTIKKNRLSGIITSIGHGLGVTIYSFFAVVGLDILINNYKDIFITFQILGSILLIIIGLKTIINSKDKNATKNELKLKDGTNSFLQGFFIAFLNPKIFVFFAAVFSQFVEVNSNITYNILLVITPGIIDTLWYIFVTIFITQNFIKSLIEENKISLQRVMGFLLILIAFTLLYNLL